MQATSAPTQAVHDPLVEDLGTFLFYLLKASSSDFFRAIAEHELSMTQIKVLHHLADELVTARPFDPQDAIHQQWVAAEALTQLPALASATLEAAGGAVADCAPSFRHISRCVVIRDSMSTPWLSARATVAARAPGWCSVSASVKSSHSPVAWAAPASKAQHFPIHPGGTGVSERICSRGESAANCFSMAGVASVDPPSTTTMV